MDGDDRAVAVITMSVENGSFIARLQASGRTYGLDQVKDDIYVIRQLEDKGNLNNDTVVQAPVTTLPTDRPRAAFTG